VPRSNRVAALDGIRGLAIILVVAFHGLLAPLVGNLHHHPLAARIFVFVSLAWTRGVDLFFVLSGFLIGGILLDNVGSKRYFAPFYIRRAHRILPLYATVLVFVFLFLRLFPSFGMRNPIPFWYYATFLQNFWMARHGWNGLSVLSMTWSLAIEEQFYLMLPVTIRYVSRSRLWWVIGGMIAGAALLRMLLIPSIAHGPFICSVLLPCRTDALGLGLAAALIKRTPTIWEAVLRWRNFVYVAMGAAFLGVVALAQRGFDGYPAKAFGLEYTVLGFFYFCLLLSVLMGGKFGAPFSGRVLCYLGRIAYGLYLFHIPCMAAAYVVGARIYPDHPGWMTIAEYFAGIALATVMAAISWEYLEKPLVQRGHRYKYDNRSREQLEPDGRSAGVLEVATPGALDA